MRRDVLGDVEVLAGFSVEVKARGGFEIFLRHPADGCFGF